MCICVSIYVYMHICIYEHVHMYVYIYFIILELGTRKRLHGGKRLRYKCIVKQHLKAIHIAVDTWETLAQDRQQ